MQLENYNAELRLQSAALIDLALALESPTILATPTLQERYRYAALDEIKSVIAARDRAISNYEKEVRAHEAADVANETTRIELRQIIAQLPAEFEAKISDDKYNGPFIAGTNCSFTIRDVYSNSWRSHAIGKKLVVYAYHETKNLPRKKDGTFSLDKAIAFVREQLQIRVTKEAKQTSDAQKLAQFKKAIAPFCTWVSSWETEKEFTVSDGFRLRVKRLSGDDEKYIVWRTTNETVTAEQLTQILTNEVGLAKKKETETVEN